MRGFVAVPNKIYTFVWEINSISLAVIVFAVDGVLMVGCCCCCCLLVVYDGTEKNKKVQTLKYIRSMQYQESACCVCDIYIILSTQSLRTHKFDRIYSFQRQRRFTREQLLNLKSFIQVKHSRDCLRIFFAADAVVHALFLRGEP